MADPLLRLEDVCVSFGGMRALDRVDLVVDQRVTGIVGPNGAGKTTLLNVMTGLIAQDRGEIAMLGRQIGRLAPPRRIRLGLGRTFQHPVLVPGVTVLEHLGFAAKRPGGPATAAIIAELGLSRWQDQPVGALPYGVRKLVDIGRALSGGPRVLLCDEPLSGLDEASRNAMIDTLAAIAGRGIGMLVIEHDLARLQAFADTLVVLGWGKVIAQGQPAAVLAEPAVRDAYGGTLTLQ